jgi:hypothetical protein
MLDEYVLVPDVFDPTAYTNPVLADAYLQFLKEPLFHEALVRDLCDGVWSQYCLANAGHWHRLTKEIVRKLLHNNRLRRFPMQASAIPGLPSDWCAEGLSCHAADPVTGIIAAHATKQQFQQAEVASVEKLTGTIWWQRRSPSATVDRKTNAYLTVLARILAQANSLMFIDPNLDPSSSNYREFCLLLAPLAGREVKARVEIHRSFCRGDGPARKFPTELEWSQSFAKFGEVLLNRGLSADVFFWDDFHERYLITDIVGVSVPAGFDITGRPDDPSTWGRLGRADRDNIQRQFDPAARPGSLKWRFRVGVP